MTKRTRIFIGILVAYALGVAFLMYRQLGDIDPRYRESAEDSLVDTAQLMAALVENASPGGVLRTDALEPVFRSLYARRFNADIYGVEKTRVELRMTVVDRQGTVVFDSRAAAAAVAASGAASGVAAAPSQVGADHSRWHDIFLALRGRYGARTTPDVEGDPRTSVMYVAAPIRDTCAGGGGEIIGAVSVGKPVQSFGQYVEAARSKTLELGATSVVAVLLLVVILSVWLVRPFGVIADYVRYVRAERSFSLPRLGRRALGAFGAAYDEMRDALAGRNYVADYVQTMTHEVKGPLSAIRGAAELLQEPMADADRARFIANIARETQRIQELVDRMMELTALESRKSLDHAAPVALRALAAEVAASAAPAAGARPRRRAAARRRRSGRRRRRLPAPARPRQPGRQRARLLAARRPRHDRGRRRMRAAATWSSATAARASPTSPKARCSRSSIRWRGRRRRRRAPASACRSSRRSPTCIAAGRRSRTSPAAARWRRSRCRATPRHDERCCAPDEPNRAFVFGAFCFCVSAR